MKTIRSKKPREFVKTWVNSLRERSSDRSRKRRILSREQAWWGSE